MSAIRRVAPWIAAGIRAAGAPCPCSGASLRVLDDANQSASSGVDAAQARPVSVRATPVSSFARELGAAASGSSVGAQAAAADCRPGRSVRRFLPRAVVTLLGRLNLTLSCGFLSLGASSRRDCFTAAPVSARDGAWDAAPRRGQCAPAGASGVAASAIRPTGSAPVPVRASDLGHYLRLRAQGFGYGLHGFGNGFCR